MAVPKGQGRETPSKIEQSKVKGRSEDPSRTSGRTALLPKPNLHRAGPGEEKTYKKRTQRALSLSLSPLHDGVIFSLHLWIDVPSCLDEFSCYLLNKIYL